MSHKIYLDFIIYAPICVYVSLLYCVILQNHCNPVISSCIPQDLIFLLVPSTPLALVTITVFSISTIIHFMNGI